ncbi:EcsC family protein [Bacillus marinisedimentorum]|uniref:EcsC family protein n=1 Tax=Bacillus marinisedimentorum TaxID=1821260 RepID=UPI0007DFE5F2|nr:EcsC family protein [Bacillus marinisedimentorum]
MDAYEQKAFDELKRWQRRLEKRPSMLGRMSKQVQNTVNDNIPERVHEAVTRAVKSMVEAVLAGSDIIGRPSSSIPGSLEGKEELIRSRLAFYRKTAAAEGAGTGFGGIVLGVADFPLLLMLKMKFLFETAEIHGYDTKRYEERIYLLYLFQLTFSGSSHQRETFKRIVNWEKEKRGLLSIDWKAFQQEYRDYIDVAKMLQLLPVVGAAAGAAANYRLLGQLGETALNGYRMRYFTGKAGE